jgi:HK97 family phage portal protein
MGLLDRLNLKRVFGGEPYNSSGIVIPNLGSDSRFAPNKQVRGITYKAIDKIGQTLSVYKPIVYNARNQALDQHPIYELYSRPNPDTRGPDFIHLAGMLYEIYGETFWYLARGERTNKVKEIYLLNPSQVELRLEDGELVGYVLHKTNGTQVPLTLDEVVHDKRPNPFNSWRGLSVLERASEYVDIELITTQFTLNYMRNNASPSGIVSLPKMNGDTFKQFALQWRENYEGPQNAGKTAFIRGEEAKFQAVGATLKDIDAKLIREMSKDDVLMMLDMPKALLGISEGEGLGRASIETHKYIYAESKLEPMMNRLDSIFEKIANMSDKSRKVFIDHESPIPEDREFEQKQIKELTNVAITVNEARARLGLEPLPDPEFDTVKPHTLAQTTPTEKKLRIVKKVELTKSQQIAKQQSEQEAFRSKLMSVSDIYSKKIKRSISQFASGQEEYVIQKMNATMKAYEELVPSVKEQSQELALLITPILIDLMEEQSTDVANFITGEPIAITPELTKEVTASITQIAGIFNADTYSALERAISEGVKNGESLQKLKKRVEGVYSDAKGYRAERIARTESSRFSNKSAELVYKQSGYSKVEWFINPGACEFCRTYAGRQKNIGSKFNNIGDVITGDEGGQLRIDYTDIDAPPLHPSCTCSLVPVVE